MKTVLTAFSFAALAIAGFGLGAGMAPGASAGVADIRIAEMQDQYPALEGDSGEEHRQIASIEYEYPALEGDSDEGMRPFSRA